MKPPLNLTEAPVTVSTVRRLFTRSRRRVLWILARLLIASYLFAWPSKCRVDNLSGEVLSWVSVAAGHDRPMVFRDLNPGDSVSFRFWLAGGKNSFLVEGEFASGRRFGPRKEVYFNSTIGCFGPEAHFVNILPAGLTNGY